MRAWVSGAALAATLMVFCGDAHAATPVVVEYTAPSECASSEAFHALLSAQLAQTSNAERPWRFSVSIRHESDYVGVLETEAGKRELRAPTCDEVTAALSLVIAMAQPELPAPPPPPPQREEPPPITMPLITPAPPPVTMPFAPPHDRIEQPPRAPSVDWRVGLRAQNWQDGSQLSATGATLTLSAELPWGFPKMLFEAGAGMLLQQVYQPLGVMGGQAMSGLSPWLFVDVQACPIDLPLGQTGLSVLGCGRVAVGLVNGVAGWGGGGARLRWQSPWHLFVEAHGNGMYGTKIEGVPALMDFGGSVGFRI